ncbi:calcium-binding protein [Pseudomonas panipatensis]|uniref:Serralysin n=1 Tax=Pseudomonas panipatensis TaxID=428992 RepID=A0A1G8FJ37_9PSED|nr:calcium-binding protein [Pseudomonas panipatensis]SDH82127.1 serralysin [Pseudomonas panipatensis]SMP53364.1 Ca2+-binding protein, RTX toxin-related [Pseudomonas panipatensis]
MSNRYQADTEQFFDDQPQEPIRGFAMANSVSPPGGNGITGNRSSIMTFDLSSRSNVVGIDNLIYRGSSTSPFGAKWGTALHQGVNLTYSFSSSASTYGSGAPGSLLNLTNEQIATAKVVMQAYANISNLTFSEVADSAISAGDIRWGRTGDTAGTPTSKAYYPSEGTPFSGDIWIGVSSSQYATPNVKGTYGYQTFLHELGHALGLTHPHSSSLPAATGEDHLKYSVMSYRSYDGASLTWGYSNSFYPTSLMLNDISAIQYLYGANTTYQSGNNTYSWTPDTSVFETIYDTGGIDSLDASNQTQSVQLNLNSGSWSQIGKAFWNGQAYVRDCLTIAYTSTIENATGSAYNDTLIGNAVANVLDGRAGADNMQGNGGDDIYYVDNAGDVVTENAGQGTDSVYASVNFTLGNNVENLTLTGSAAINGTGNSLNNLITGNAAANLLDGGAGADTLKGMGGDDSYYVDSGDVVVENLNEGTDSVYAGFNYTLGANLENLTLAGTSAINGTGNGLNNLITGNAAANLLDGGAGADTLKGMGGNDTYSVDNSGDLVIENANEGTDTVNASISYSLGANVENLTLTGNAISGTGNTLNNVLIGNAYANTLNGGAGNDTLDGGAGSDTLYGGLGDDTYWIDSSGDIVSENANEGTDTINASVSYTLGANVENLTLTGASAINGTGNELNNIITGNAADNVLNGLGGVDTLIGQGGADRYIVDNVGDIVVERANEGNDWVEIRGTGVSQYTLPDNVENLDLASTNGNINATGNNLDNYIRGTQANNVITGGKGNDLLSGQRGSDTYIFNRGDSSDTIQEIGKDLPSAAVDVDILKFGSGINADQLWFSKQDYHGSLIVGVIGTSDKVSIEFWYANKETNWSESYIEQFQTADGKTLTYDKVDQLVNAMAAFAPPAMGQTTLPTNYQQALAPVIAAAWA